MPIKKTIFYMGVILGFSLICAWLLVATKPQSERKPPQISRLLVNVSKAVVKDASMQISALGTVMASQTTIVRSRVTGQVERLGANFDVGAVVKKGEMLILLDDDVYRNTLASKKSTLAKSQADYEIEMGQQEVARAETQQLLNLSNSLVNDVQISALTLRGPQLAQAKAAVDVAEAAVKLAGLNLTYTTIRAPYNAMIIERNVSVGSLASTAEKLLTLVGINEYQIEAAVGLDMLEALAKNHSVGQKVRVRSGAGVVREGKIVRSIASLNQSTRMGRILISVSDPLGIKNGKSALVLGDQATVELSVGNLKNVVVLPRLALHSGNIVWVAVPVENEKSAYTLDLRPVEVRWKDTKTAYINSGIKEHELVVTSVIPSPVQGMLLRIPQAPIVPKSNQLPAQPNQPPAQQSTQSSSQQLKTNIPQSNESTPS